MPTPIKNPFAALSPKAVGVLAAVITVTIWTSFIVIARASVDPARGGLLNVFDIVYARLLGAGLVLIVGGGLALVTRGIVFGVREVTTNAIKSVVHHVASTRAGG